MTIDGKWLASVLRDEPAKIDAWRSQASQLKHLVAGAEVAGTVSDDLLTSVEGTCTSIYQEIRKCARVIATVSTNSPDAASQLAALDDALHLVLLEVTELTTELYAVRSRVGKVVTPMLSSP
jgi:hypothetical protein